ncbi:hypothetical protein EMCRGX_G015063 [Ephydatia muelleri]
MTSFISAFKEYLVRWCDEDSVSVVPDSQITKSSDDTCTVKWGKACYHGAIVASGDYLSQAGGIGTHSYIFLVSSNERNKRSDDDSGKRNVVLRKIKSEIDMSRRGKLERKTSDANKKMH